MNITFVCLGNICRSPMAAGVLRHLALAHPIARTWTIHSCGTGPWHVGKAADPRTIATLRRYDVPLDHVARQLAPADYASDLLLAMDDDNLAVLRQRTPRGKNPRIELLGSYDPLGVREVADPYYGDDDGFDQVYQHVLRCCQALIQQANR